MPIVSLSGDFFPMTQPLRVHKHLCEGCDTVWEHSDANQSATTAHRCPACGKMQWAKYGGEQRKGRPMIRPQQGFLSTAQVLRMIEVRETIAAKEEEDVKAKAAELETRMGQCLENLRRFGLPPGDMACLKEIRAFLSVLAGDDDDESPTTAGDETHQAESRSRRRVSVKESRAPTEAAALGRWLSDGSSLSESESKALGFALTTVD